MKDFDQVFKVIGHFGSFQLVMYMIFQWTGFYDGMVALSSVFTLYKAPFECVDDGISINVTDSRCGGTSYDQRWMSRS